MGLKSGHKTQNSTNEEPRTFPNDVLYGTALRKKPPWQPQPLGCRHQTVGQTKKEDTFKEKATTISIMSSKPEEKSETKEKEQAKLALEALEGESVWCVKCQMISAIFVTPTSFVVR